LNSQGMSNPNYEASAYGADLDAPMYDTVALNSQGMSNPNYEASAYGADLATYGVPRRVATGNYDVPTSFTGVPASVSGDEGTYAQLAPTDPYADPPSSSNYDSLHSSVYDAATPTLAASTSSVYDKRQSTQPPSAAAPGAYLVVEPDDRAGGAYMQFEDPADDSYMQVEDQADGTYLKVGDGPEDEFGFGIEDSTTEVITGAAPLQLEKATLTRMEAEKILLTSPPGDFVTRMRANGDVVVSTRVASSASGEPCFIHSILSPSDGGWLVNNTDAGLGTFATSDALVEHILTLDGAFSPLPLRNMVMSCGPGGQNWHY